MSENLMIIESPNKIETIKKFLNKDWKILATVGHIRDLGKTGERKLGFDEKTLEPTWIIPRLDKKIKGANIVSAKERINNINAAAREAKNIYIASDPDREGEAIAWHVYEVLSDADKKKVKRITFNEITKEAVLKAISHPRDINDNWVKSQFARRILDRLIGFTLSRLVYKKLHGRSAGRVQTVALKMIYDREKEIAAFESYKWWTLDTFVNPTGDELILRAANPKIKSLEFFNQKQNETESPEDNKEDKTEILFANEQSANAVIKSLADTFEVYAVDKPQYRTHQQPQPFKTSTLQITAINKLGWSISKVTQVAQRLYEGIKVHGEHTALISYPRTDSTRYSPIFVEKAQQYIVKQYGQEYYDDRHAHDAKKASANNNVQDAHEAIRIIDLTLDPERIKDQIAADDYRLYRLIWLRTISSLMAPSKTEIISVRLINNENKFYTHNSKVIFDGYRKVWDAIEESSRGSKIDLNKYQVGATFKLKSTKAIEHTAAPPPHFNQATLVAALEKAGVGRPSTYRQMASVATDRGYAEIKDRAFFMTQLGNEIIENLNKFFSEIINIKLTKEMEEHLDEISKNGENWKEWILEFKKRFDKELKTATSDMETVQPKLLDRKCPECGAPLVERYSKKTHKTFIGCSNYPKCHYVESSNGEPNVPPVILDELCPDCGQPLVQRTNKSGNKFIGCSNYPKCHYARPSNMTNAEYAEIKAIKQKDGKKAVLPPRLKTLYSAAYQKNNKKKTDQ